MRWSLHPVDAGLGAWAARWDALNQRRFGAHPMLTASFVDGLLRHFPAPPVYLCVGEDEAGDQAMCLLRPQRIGVWSSYLPSQAQISPSLLGGRLDLAGLLRALPSSALQLDLLALDPLVQGDALHAGGESPQRSRQALTMAVELGDDEAYWAARSKKLRDNLRRQERGLEAAGLQERLVEHAEPAAVLAAVERYAQLESSGWKGQGGTALEPGNRQHRFYAELLADAATRGEARVFELWFDEQLVASRLMLAGPTMVIALKTCYEQAFKHHAPGRLLLRRVLARGHSLWPGRGLEFYTNASADQLAWATRQREILNMTVYRGALWARLAGWRRRLQVSSLASGSDEVQVLRADQPWPSDAMQFFASAESRRIAYGSHWLKHLAATVFPGDPGARVYLLRRGGRVVAALPVRLGETAAAGVEALSNYYTALYAPLVEPHAEPTLLVPLLRALRRDRPGCAQLRFAPMDPAEPAFAVLRASLRAAGLLPFDYFCHGNWYHPVAEDGQTYMARRKSNFRGTIRRADRKLEAAGARFEVLQSSADVDRAVAAYLHVYERSWKKQEPYPEFIPGLVRLCAQQGWLRLGVLWLDEQPIAAQLWMVANRRAEIYKVAYDEAHKPLTPGGVLTARLMQHVIDVDQVAEVDYLIGDDSYKAQWMSQRRERWGLVAYNPWSPRGLLGWARESLARRLKPRRKASEAEATPSSSFATTDSSG